MRIIKTPDRPLVAFAVAVAIAGCAWGNEKLQRKVASLTPDRVATATIELRECGKTPKSLDRNTLAELLKRIGALAAAPSIGKQEEWADWRIVRLRTATDERFKITVGSRESLGGKPIVALEQDPSGGMGFYVGDSFWSWLSQTPESLALGPVVTDVQPCS